MKNCNNQGTFENGKCKCVEGYFGADCGTKPEKLSSLSSVQLGIRGWKSFYLDSANEFEFTITSDGKTQGTDMAQNTNVIVYT